MYVQGGELLQSSERTTGQFGESVTAETPAERKTSCLSIQTVFFFSNIFAGPYSIQVMKKHQIYIYFVFTKPDLTKL